MAGLTKRQKEVYSFIEEYLETHGAAPSYEEIREHLGIRSVSTVHKHLKQLEKRGYINSPWGSGKRVLSLAGEDQAPRAASVPLLGMVAAGAPIEALEAPEDIEVPESLLRGGECFALRVRGESMIEDGIRDGDVILVERKQTAENGATVVAVVDGEEATVKKFHRKGSTVELRPANRSMEPIVLEAARVSIRGVVIGLMRSYF